MIWQSYKVTNHHPGIAFHLIIMIFNKQYSIQLEIPKFFVSLIKSGVDDFIIHPPVIYMHFFQKLIFAGLNELK